MRPANVRFTWFLLLAVMAGGWSNAQDTSPAKLWQEIDQVLPRRGSAMPTAVPAAAVDWPTKVGKTEELMVRSGGTPVEPFAMYHLSNFYYEAGRLDEALAMLETLKTQFPSHPLVTLRLAADQRPLVLQAIEDCAAEIAWRNRHPRAAIPVPVLDPSVTATLQLSTGDVKIRFYRNVAPKHVENFIKSVEAGTYDGTKIGQVVHEQVVNLGDPASKEPNAQPANPTAGGPGQPHEFSNLSHVRGTVAMARGVGDSHLHQFQVVLKDQMHFDFSQTIFGKVVEGLEVLDAISRLPKDQFQRPSPEVVVKKVTITKE